MPEHESQKPKNLLSDLEAHTHSWRPSEEEDAMLQKGYDADRIREERHEAQKLVLKEKLERERREARGPSAVHKLVKAMKHKIHTTIESVRERSRVAAATKKAKENLPKTVIPQASQAAERETVVPATEKKNEQKAPKKGSPSGTSKRPQPQPV